MKKLISLLLLLTFALGLSGCQWSFDTEKDISEYGAVYEYHLQSFEHLNQEFLVGNGVYKYNSVSDVDESIIRESEFPDDFWSKTRLAEYDEAFFEDNVVFVLPFCSADSSHCFDFVGIKYDEASLTFIVDEDRNGGVALMAVTYIYYVIELPREMADGFESFEVKRI